MKIIVCIKRVGLLADEVDVLDDGSAVAPDVLDHALNEWDAYAIEEAVRLRDDVGGEVVVVTVGDADADEVLRRGLALGADRAIRVKADVAAFDSLGTARALHAAVAPEHADLVLCGVQSSDGSQGGTGSALGALLDVPTAAVVRSIERLGDALLVQRELEGGVIAETEIRTPALLTVQTGINEPRYASFRQIKQAEQREIEVCHVGEVRPGLRSRGVRVPVVGEGGEMIGGNATAVAQRVVEIIRERMS